MSWERPVSIKILFLLRVLLCVFLGLLHRSSIVVTLSPLRWADRRGKLRHGDNRADANPAGHTPKVGRGVPAAPGPRWRSQPSARGRALPRWMLGREPPGRGPQARARARRKGGDQRPSRRRPRRRPARAETVLGRATLAVRRRRARQPLWKREGRPAALLLLLEDVAGGTSLWACQHTNTLCGETAPPPSTVQQGGLYRDPTLAVFGFGVLLAVQPPRDCSRNACYVCLRGGAPRCTVARRPPAAAARARDGPRATDDAGPCRIVPMAGPTLRRRCRRGRGPGKLLDEGIARRCCLFVVRLLLNATCDV